MLGKALGEASLDGSRCTLLFADERCVPLSDPESNFQAIDSHVSGEGKPLAGATVVVIAQDGSPAELARDYEERVRSCGMGATGVPSMDLLLLGMGPDGHTASLFPGHALLEETSRLVAEIEDSPKPPPCRITMTYPLLNASRQTVFVCTGSSKAEAVRAIRDDPSCELPAARVKAGAPVVFLLDEAANK